MCRHGTIVVVGRLDSVVGDGRLQDHRLGSRPVLQPDRSEVPQEEERGKEKRITNAISNFWTFLFKSFFENNIELFAIVKLTSK